MDHISPDTLRFLKDLNSHNDRDWFEANKSRYLQAQAQLVEFVDLLIPHLVKLDSTIAGLEAKKTVFRIYRDVRFSKNKAPYKTNMGAHISGGGKNAERAGFYLHIEPGSCMLAGGAYMPSSAWLKAIRKEIHYNAAPFKKILDSASFKKYFGEVQGESLKTSPRDYDADHPEIELLKMKSFTAVHPLKDKELTSKGFKDHALKVFKALAPFDGYLNMALD